MGFGTYLKDLLRPLGLYNLETGPGSGELEALGAGMDEVFTRFMELERENLLPTAEGAGLERYRDLLPYIPNSGSVENRREAIMALLRIDDASFTLSALQNTVAGCGIHAWLEEADTPQTVNVSFPGLMGEPEGFSVIQKRLEQILPCHLDIVYALRYLLWSELEGYGLVWRRIENARLTWKELECYREEV